MVTVKEICIIISDIIAALLVLMLHATVIYAWNNICHRDITHVKTCPDIMPLFIICGAIGCVAFDIVYALRLAAYVSQKREISVNSSNRV